MYAYAYAIGHRALFPPPMRICNRRCLFVCLSRC